MWNSGASVVPNIAMQRNSKNKTYFISFVNEFNNAYIIILILASAQ